MACPSPLYFGEFVIFKYEAVTYIYAERQQCDGNLGHYTGIVVLYKGIIAPDINNSTEHNIPPRKSAPSGLGADQY